MCKRCLRIGAVTKLRGHEDRGGGRVENNPSELLSH